jgi:hypothetical protein
VGREGVNPRHVVRNFFLLKLEILSQKNWVNFLLLWTGECKLPLRRWENNIKINIKKLWLRLWIGLIRLRIRTCGGLL